MKPTFRLALLFVAAYASAEEAANRAAIGRVIAALNGWPQPTALFTEDADISELDRLPEVKPLAARFPGSPCPGRSTVIISHEPWGEATIGCPGAESAPWVEVLNPRIVSGAIRFITPDVALADGSWTYKPEGAAARTIPLLFVMKRSETHGRLLPSGCWRLVKPRGMRPQSVTDARSCR